MEHDWMNGHDDGDGAFEDELDSFASEFEEVIDALLDYLDAVVGGADDGDAGWDDWGDDGMVM